MTRNRTACAQERRGADLGQTRNRERKEDAAPVQAVSAENGTATAASAATKPTTAGSTRSAAGAAKRSAAVMKKSSAAAVDRAGEAESRLPDY